MTTPVDPQVRKIVTRAIRRGVITPAEGAAFANVSKQAVQRWVGPGSARWRERYVTEAMRKMMSGGRRVPSKTELRREADEAAETWEWRNGADRLDQGKTPH